jgi:DNA polymerase I-like protein with 3'-5' exonuclease and polymerase domains/uracil-DNA glycosylase
MIVGEAPGEKEVERGIPFVGASGWLLDQCLREAGLDRGLALITNVCPERPPGNDLEHFMPTKGKGRSCVVSDFNYHYIDGRYISHHIREGLRLLEALIDEAKPDVIVALGNLSLWALTKEWGIRKWRSSLLRNKLGSWDCKVIPSIHPAAVLREWPLRPLLVHDLKRAKWELEQGRAAVPGDYELVIAGKDLSHSETLARLAEWTARASAEGLRLACDIETRAGYIACIGFAPSAKSALTIPFMCVERHTGFWTAEEEFSIIEAIRTLLMHPQVEIIGQNWAYDAQYLNRWWFIPPRLGWDTMITHHSMFSAQPKSLDHLSSIYCRNHRYWKDDGRNWDPSSMDERQFWLYNGEDCVRTFEIAEAEASAIDALSTEWPKLREVVSFQHRLQPAVVRMMLRGMRSDDKTRAQMAIALISRVAEIQGEIDYIAGIPVNIRSSPQMRELLYGTLHQSPIYKRNPDGSRGNLTTDDDALEKIASREPILQPWIARVRALRSAGVFHSTFVQMPRDVDGRLRCSYNIAGTKTYRFSSSENAFGSGGNLQNVPSGDDAEEALIPLPNIRKLFLFDRDREGFDLDGDSADLRIVTGESGCKAMQAYFASGAKPYVEIAREFYRDPTITKQHPSYKRMKALCHGSNYGGEPSGLSQRIGLPVHDIERMQNWYFGMCPEIRDWQAEIRRQGEYRGWIENPFGYRLYNHDRWSRKVANEFLAWTPQSTVAVLINKILVAIDEQLPDVELLLQVHDSLTGQYPQHLAPARRREILAIASSVEIPCRSGPITVPAGLKTSTISWGDCK